MVGYGELLVFLCKQGSRQGLAFFIDDHHLLTCAHVVSACLGLDPDAALDVAAQSLDCEFVTNSNQRYFTASLVLYRRALVSNQGSPQQQRLSDLAVLRVDAPHELPLQPRPARFAELRPGLDKVLMSGAVSDREGKIRIASGTVTKLVEDGRFYVRVDPGSNAGPGYSGGPVEHASNGTVLGLVQKAPQTGGDARIIPANIIRDALAGTFTLEVSSVRTDDVPLSAISFLDDEALMSTLLKAKDRQEHEDQLSQAITEAFDPKQRRYSLCVTLLKAPPESCPDVFRSRLADRDFSTQPVWRARPTWCDEWPSPLWRLDLGHSAQRAFEFELNELVKTIEGVGEGSSLDKTDIRTYLIKRVGLVIVTVQSAVKVSEILTHALRSEVDRWIAAHGRAGRLPFCLLLIFELSEVGPLINIPFFRRQVDPEDAVRTSLATLPNLLVRRIEPLRRLRADLDLDKWIRRTWKALSRRGHQPLVIKARAFEKTYGSQSTREITFWQWQRRLDHHSREIFGGIP